MLQSNKNIEEEFQRICDIIESRRSLALAAVNQQHLLTCWELGAILSNHVKTGNWGDSTVVALADYIKKNHPGLKGYGKSNLYNMMKFYNEYSSPMFEALTNKYEQLNTLPEVSQVPTPQIFQPLAGKIMWQ